MTQPALSVLDLSPVSSGQQASQALQQTLELAKTADRCGYERYWIAEHHNGVVFLSSATEILIALAVQATERIRVGSGGVMLPNHSPLKVAENFLTLEALFPGRIDLGLGRAPGTDGRTALALRRSREALAADDFPQQIAMLRAFAGELKWPAGSVFEGVQAEPRGIPLPPLWVLGSSLYGAQLAGELGVGFAFAYHFSQEDPVAAVKTYHRHFRPGALEHPYTILGVNALVAETDEEAQELALSGVALSQSILSGRVAPIQTPQEARKLLNATPAGPTALMGKATVGTPQKVWIELQELAARAGAQELMVTTYAHDPAKRHLSYELLAKAAGLGEGSASSAKD